MTDFKQLFQQFTIEKKLNRDQAQLNVVDALNTIYLDLLRPQKKSWFGLGRAKPVKGLYVWGGVGRGKTMIMDLFFTHVPIQEKRRVHFNIFMLDVHNSIKLLREGGRGENPLKTIASDIAQTCRLLCFDEFQVYDIADAMVLSELFKSLFEAGVTVIATSNVAPDYLYKDGLQRSRFLPFIPLVKSHMDVVHLDSETDYRQQALRENGTYFIEDEDAMETLFVTLAHGHDISKNTIDIDGRALNIPQATVDLAWVDFTELCEKPRGAIDYKALSDRFDTVFLNHVPRMGYDRRNEAKRFILLVDTLYDAGVKLVVNAHAEPQKLYYGDDHAFEFERTVSRLLEMQGEEYLSKTSEGKIDRL